MKDKILNLILGNLSKNIIAFKDPIIFITFIIITIIIIIILFYIIYFKLWKNIWNKWITSLDHKKIGIMYMILGVIMLIRGIIDALMMRIQQSFSFKNSYGFLSSNHFDQIFTAHGVIMIFFVAMPLITGIMNYIVPLQIGSKDLAYPYLNNLSFWFTCFGAILIMISLFVGEFANTGWLAYPPLSGILYNPYIGVDYYIWSLQIANISTLLSSINFIVTILKMRIRYMGLMKMPIFIWTVLCSNILILISFPILTTVLFMLSLDRLMYMNFFTNYLGGSPMMYINFIWMWGHPEVYILILPIFGIFSEIVSTFFKKKLFGHNSMIYAILSITILSYIVWLHHFFTMGAGANINSFFGITTMIISIPTGVKIYNWLLTIYNSKIKIKKFKLPILWTIAFFITFIIGGITGILLSIPPLDYVLHNSLFLVAHFHTTIIGGVIFGLFAGINYWFPKIFGYKLNEFYGKCSFYLWILGFCLAFIPLYILGLMGITRREYHFENNNYKILFIIAFIGIIIIIFGIIFFIIQIIISYTNKNKLKDKNGDIWNGRTLEWLTTSPPPEYNFYFIPNKYSIDLWYKIKKNIKKSNIKLKKLIKIKLYSNNIWGFIIAGLSTIMAFTIIWHMWLITILTLITIIIILIISTFNLKSNIKYIYKKKIINYYNNIINNEYYYSDKNIIKNKNNNLLGFGLYILSDILIYICLFTTYIILKKNFKFNINNLFSTKIYIIISLLSFLSCFLFKKYSTEFNISRTIIFLIFTGISRLLFLLLKTIEIKNLIINNFYPQRNAFLTSFFTIIGLHYIHIIINIIWILILIFQINKFSLKNKINNRIKLLFTFCYFIDIIWMIFIIIYLINL